MANYDYAGQTAEVVYDPASNRVITIHPGGLKQSVDAGNSPDAAVAASKAHVENTYTNVGGVEIREESGASDRFAAEFEERKAANRAAEIAAGPPPEENNYDGSTVYTGSGKPNVKEFMDATGADFKTASDVLYGVVGSNTDTRDWDTIMSSGRGADIITTSRAATNEMYGGVSVRMVNGNAMLVGGNGTLLRGLDTNSPKSTYESLKTFGVSSSDWANQDWQSQADSQIQLFNNSIDQQQQILNSASSTEAQKEAAREAINDTKFAIKSAQDTANYLTSAREWGSDWLSPFASWENTTGKALTTGLSQSTRETEQGNLGVVEQTLMAPEAVVPGTVNVATPTPSYEAAPQASAAVPASTTPQAAAAIPTTQTPFTPAPTTVSGQPVTTGVTGTGVYPQAPVMGTMSVPLQTAGTSAVPKSVQVRPNYTGTTRQNLTSQSQQGFGGLRTYVNQFGQELSVTVDASGNPLTYVPPGYLPKGSPDLVPYGQNNAVQEAISGQQMNGIMGSVTGSILNGTLNPPQRFFAAEGGLAPDPMLEAKYRIATMNGYNGPKTNTALNNFANSSEGMKRKFNAIGTAMAEGGVVPKNTVIAGQPHRLAYVNPQEEKMLKAAGGAGVPSHGGIPAYFTIGSASEAGAGATVTDPATGTVYTSDGESWSTDDGQDVGSGMASTPQVSEFDKEQALRDQNLLRQTMDPRQAPVSYLQPQSADFIAPTAGMTTAVAPMAEAAQVGTVEAAQMPMMAAAAQMTPQNVASLVQGQTDQMQAAQGTVAPEAQIQAAQQQQTSMAGLEAAQGTAYMMSNPVQREIQQGELISGAADAEKAAQFNEQIQAAQATPTKQATVQGQLEGLMQQFEGGETPAWAAGSMRTAMATLSARGLGASSMAGQAVIQATMEAALPIAQMDAQTTAQFEAQNLSNRQQRAMLAAQQRAQFLGQEFDQAFQARVQNSARIGDIANMNFTAEQNIALENSRAANTMNLNNLSNRQAMVMAEAAALSNLDMANLNNRQQAAVQNAQNFLQVDMQNLSNAQQTNMFKAQQNIQALFTDQAAENAAQQFNASSENQTNQFFANLSSQTSQFNAAQRNAMDQFNVNSVNALREFNSEIQQQRDLFNAQNGLVIAQANAQWRQNIATLNTAAQNESNMLFAKDMNQMTTLNLDAYWQTERDIMSYAFQTANNNADRATAIFKQQLVNDADMNNEKAKKSAAMAKAAASFAEKLIFGD